MSKITERHPLIVTITGPSGSGKTVLSNALREHGLEPLVSTTTRAPRKGEVDGVDYHFISRADFQADVAAGRFIENVEYNGILYGVSVEEADRAFDLGRSAVLVAEPHGVEQIKTFAETRGWRVLRVFVDNPEEILLGRLLNRLLLDAAGLPMDEDRIKGMSDWIKRLQAAGTDQPAIRVVLKDMLAATAPLSLAQTDDGAEVSRRIDAAASRLSSFLFEQENWVRPARSDASLYDHVTDSFDANVQAQVIDLVMNSVASLENPADRPRAAKP